ncbi:MAG: amidohydrolase family protein, partial [Desulfurivibrionaceae bacterium]
MHRTRFIVAGSFIDGSGAKARRNVYLAVKDKIITAIGPAADLPDSGEAAIDDFSHCTILPALIDCSVSLARSPSVDPGVRLATEEAGHADKTARLARHSRYCHIHGVLGVADSDDQPGPLDHYQKKMTEGGIIEIRSARLCRSITDCQADNPADRDFLKIAYSADIEDQADSYPQLSHQELARILMRRGGRKAVVVANGRRRVEEALTAGCDAIEQGYNMGEDNLRRMAAKEVLWIPSVSRAKNGLDGAGSGGEVCCRFSHRYAAPGQPLPGAEAFWKKMLAEQLAQLRIAGKVGVTTALGTGAGSTGIIHGESMAEEIKLFIKAGCPLEETIHCASETGVRFFGMKGLGKLTVGRNAT